MVQNARQDTGLLDLSQAQIQDVINRSRPRPNAKFEYPKVRWAGMYQHTHSTDEQPMVGSMIAGPCLIVGVCTEKKAAIVHIAEYKSADGTINEDIAKFDTAMAALDKAVKGSEEPVRLYLAGGSRETMDTVKKVFDEAKKRKWVLHSAQLNIDKTIPDLADNPQNIVSLVIDSRDGSAGNVMLLPATREEFMQPQFQRNRPKFGEHIQKERKRSKDLQDEFQRTKREIPYSPADEAAEPRQLEQGVQAAPGVGMLTANELAHSGKIIDDLAAGARVMDNPERADPIWANSARNVAGDIVIAHSSVTGGHFLHNDESSVGAADNGWGLLQHNPQALKDQLLTANTKSKDFKELHEIVEYLRSAHISLREEQTRNPEFHRRFTQEIARVKALHPETRDMGVIKLDPLDTLHLPRVPIGVPGALPPH